MMDVKEMVAELLKAADSLEIHADMYCARAENSRFARTAKLMRVTAETLLEYRTRLDVLNGHVLDLEETIGKIWDCVDVNSFGYIPSNSSLEEMNDLAEDKADVNPTPDSVQVEGEI